MKKIPLLLIMATCLSVVVSGCPRVFYVNLHNHTGRDLTVYIHSESLKLPRGSSVTFKYAGVPQPLKITNEKEGWQYMTTDLPSEYVKPLGMGIVGYESNWQIEPDGLIYLIKVDAKVPVQQPPGFPLRPRS